MKERFNIDEPAAINPLSAPNQEPVATTSPDRARDRLVDIEQQYGSTLAQSFLLKKIHPVVIIGTSAAGKTTLLSSLISRIQGSNSVNVRFMDDFGLPEHENRDYGQWSKEEARAFYNNIQKEASQGTIPPLTRIDHPFFIPLALTIPGNSDEINIAFMESNGEWYKPDKAQKNYYPELRAEINGFVENFQNGITFIHVAPATQIDNDRDLNKEKELLTDANFALRGALENYESARRIKNKDHHIFLVTKWDTQAKKLYKKNMFDGLDIEKIEFNDVINLLNENYNETYSKFQQMSQLFKSSSVIPYCSGIFTNNTLQKLFGDQKALIDKFSENLWNEIYTKGACSYNNGDLIFKKPPPPVKDIKYYLTKILNFVSGG